MAIDKDKQRARWKRNKLSARARSQPKQKQLDAELVRRCIEERDRRAATAYQGADRWPEAPYLYGKRLERAVELAADVWLATMLYEVQWGQGTATTARIFGVLKSMDRMHGYTEGSLRKMIPKARDRVLFLETHGEPWRKGHLYWPPFDTADQT